VPHGCRGGAHAGARGLEEGEPPPASMRVQKHWVPPREVLFVSCCRHNHLCGSPYEGLLSLKGCWVVIVGVQAFDKDVFNNEYF
jgi:hypothetical protein